MVAKDWAHTFPQTVYAQPSQLKLWNEGKIAELTVRRVRMFPFVTPVELTP